MSNSINFFPGHAHHEVESPLQAHSGIGQGQGHLSELEEALGTQLQSSSMCICQYPDMKLNVVKIIISKRQSSASYVALCHALYVY